jgi:hypothetical protein
MKRIAIAAVLVLGFAGCTSAQDTATVANSVAAAETALTVAESAATVYVKLPPCGGTSKICSNPSVIAKILAYDNTAYTAVKAAENNSGTIAAALTALTTFQGLIGSLPTTPPATGTVGSN